MGMHIDGTCAGRPRVVRLGAIVVRYLIEFGCEIFVVVVFAGVKVEFCILRFGLDRGGVIPSLEEICLLLEGGDLEGLQLLARHLLLRGCRGAPGLRGRETLQFGILVELFEREEFKLFVHDAGDVIGGDGTLETGEGVEQLSFGGGDDVQLDVDRVVHEQVMDVADAFLGRAVDATDALVEVRTTPKAILRREREKGVISDGPQNRTQCGWGGEGK